MWHFVDLVGAVRRARLARVSAALMVDECADEEGMGTVPSSVDVLSDDSDEPVCHYMPRSQRDWKRLEANFESFSLVGSGSWTNAAHSARDGQDSGGGRRGVRVLRDERVWV